MGNVVAREDVKGNVYPRKARDVNKIDPAVALIANVSLQMRVEDDTISYNGLRSVG
jgi:phage terminase large subunit-like protein